MSKETFNLDDLADACVDAEIPDGLYESLCISLQSRSRVTRKKADVLPELTETYVIDIAESYDLLSIQDGGRINRDSLIAFAKEIASGFSFRSVKLENS